MDFLKAATHLISRVGFLLLAFFAQKDESGGPKGEKGDETGALNGMQINSHLTQCAA